MINRLKNWLTSQLMPMAYIESTDGLKGMVVMIAGGSRGIGQATADLLSKKGATVVALSSTTDVRKPASIAKAVQTTLKQYGRIDALINCVGIFSDKAIMDTKLADFQKVMDINVVGAFNLAQAVIPTMRKQGSGLILNIGSKISHNTNVAPNKVAYATSKYALEGFSFALNKELKGSGIRVTCLMPGTVATFISRKGSEYLSATDVASVIHFIVASKNIDFESIVLKSVNQNI